MTQISVGFLPIEEIEKLIDLAQNIWTATYEHILPPGQVDFMLDLLYSPDRLRQEIADGHPMFSAFLGDEMIGFAHLFIEGHQARLDKLYVSPFFQRMGVGRSLVDAASGHAIRADCSLMTLRVNRANATAIAAYEKMGFGIIATNKKDIGAGYVMDDYLMLVDLVSTG